MRRPVKIAWPSSFAEKKSWLTRVSVGLFVSSVALAVVLAFRTLDAEAGGLPRFVEAALWLHVLVHLGISIASAARAQSSTDPTRVTDTTLRVISLVFAAFILFTLRWGALFANEPGAFARSRTAALLSTTHLGIPFVALAAGLALCALAQVTATTTRDFLAPLALDEAVSNAATLWAPRLVLAWTIAFGSLALLGYATGSWSLLPE